MKKIKKMVLFVFFILFGFNISAANLIKITVVDWSEITGNYKWFQSQYEKLSKKRKTIMEMVEKENTEIKKIENEIERLYDPDQISMKQSEVLKRKNELNAFYIEANDLLQKKEEQLLEESKKKILEAIKKVAIQKGVSLVFSKEQLLYASDSYTNMTEKVLKELNK